MKIALYVEDGLEQIVLTPQTPTEKALLGKMHEAERKLTIKKGGFYACRGGWTRHSTDDESTILVITEEEKKPASDPITMYRAQGLNP